MTEILQRKFLLMNRMHRTATVRNCANFVCIEFLPPVQRRHNINPHDDHAQILTMIRTSITQVHHEFVVVGANDQFIGIVVERTTVVIDTNIAPTASASSTIALCPRILRVSHTADSRFPSFDFKVFKFDHFLPPQHRTSDRFASRNYKV